MKRTSWLILFLIVFLVFSLFSPVYAETFGYEEEEAGGDTIDDVIRGSYHTCPETGTGVSISAYIKWYYQGTKIKFALYKKSDESLVTNGVTEEKTKTSGNGYVTEWITCNFETGPSLENIDYYIVAWADQYCLLYYTYSAAKGAKDDETYNGFPNPWAQESQDQLCCIYCTYTPGAVGEYTETFGETVTVSSSLYVWRAFFHRQTETLTIMMNMYSWREKATFHIEPTTITEESNKWIELARFFTEPTTITETATFTIETLIVITEFTETLAVQASLLLWRAIQIDFTETITVTAALEALAEQFITYVEFAELIQLDAALSTIFHLIAAPVEVTTFGTVAFIIAVIALAIGIVALRRRE